MLPGFKIFILIAALLIIHPVKGQEGDFLVKGFRNNAIKVNLLPIGPLIAGNNEKWLGFEYERFIRERVSLTAMVDFGLFEDYTFIKYHDYFDDYQGFSYTQINTTTRGYHIIPTIRYYFLYTKRKKGQGFYLSGSLDWSQYFQNQESYLSLSGFSQTKYNSTSRLSVGGILGCQYVAFTRLIIDINISLYAPIITVNNDSYQNEIPPLHANWVLGENVGYSTINVMLGYAFGGGKRK